VTGTFHHQSAKTLDVHLDGHKNPIGCTANHLFWSADRQGFIRADQLEPAERLDTPNGTVRVASVTPRNSAEPVFNLEIQGEHVYRVSESGILVHNTGAADCGACSPGQAPSAVPAQRPGVKVIGRRPSTRAERWPDGHVFDVPDEEYSWPKNKRWLDEGDVFYKRDPEIPENLRNKFGEPTTYAKELDYLRKERGFVDLDENWLINSKCLPR
jgi:hypothetical protein